LSPRKIRKSQENKIDQNGVGEMRPEWSRVQVRNHRVSGLNDFEYWVLKNEKLYIFERNCPPPAVSSFILLSRILA